jgi:hypothetical protein
LGLGSALAFGSFGVPLKSPAVLATRVSSTSAETYIHICERFLGLQFALALLTCTYRGDMGYWWGGGCSVGFSIVEN